MPHVIVKLWPGKSEQQKQKLAEGVTKAVMSSLGYGEESISVSLEEIAAGDWTEKVYKPDILNGPGKLYKQAVLTADMSSISSLLEPSPSVALAIAPRKTCGARTANPDAHGLSQNLGENEWKNAH